MTTIVRRATTLLSDPSTPASYPGSASANPRKRPYGNLRMAMCRRIWCRVRMFTDHVFAVVDKRDAEGFAALFAPDGRFTFGNADPIVGRAAIAGAVAGFFAGIAGLRHEIRNRWETGA